MVMMLAVILVSRVGEIFYFLLKQYSKGQINIQSLQLSYPENFPMAASFHTPNQPPLHLKARIFVSSLFLNSHATTIFDEVKMWSIFFLILFGR